jgi:hypothetical protein
VQLEQDGTNSLLHDGAVAKCTTQPLKLATTRNGEVMRQVTLAVSLLYCLVFVERKWITRVLVDVRFVPSGKKSVSSPCNKKGAGYKQDCVCILHLSSTTGSHNGGEGETSLPGHSMFFVFGLFFFLLFFLFCIVI